MNNHPFTMIKSLGTQSIRKFNRVELVENAVGERFVLKSCALNNETGCQLLLEEFNFSFDIKGLPEVVKLDKSETELQLLLKYKEGAPLDEYWKTLNRKDRKRFLIQFIPKFLELLSRVHQKGIIHNDIRPGNILINREEIHLIDFGMATKVGEESNRKILFSLQYASPELILNKYHLLNASSDLFSFALIVIQLFNGKPILTHSNPSVLTNLAITYPLELKGIVPRELVPILEKMCSKAAFKTSPNRMSNDDVNKLLIAAQTMRTDEFLIESWEECLRKWEARRRFLVI